MKKLIFIVFLILFLKEVIAIGIVTDYLENNTLELMEGTSTTYQILLQNTEEEINVRVGLDSEIAEIINYEEEYILPAGISHTPIVFNITAPKHAKVGGKYVIGYYMEPISGKGGAIPFGIRMNKQLIVKITKDPDKSHIGDYLYMFIIVSIILVLPVLPIVLYIKKRKKKF